jgi:hypothetical protein
MLLNNNMFGRNHKEINWSLITLFSKDDIYILLNMETYSVLNIFRTNTFLF